MDFTDKEPTDNNGAMGTATEITATKEVQTAPVAEENDGQATDTPAADTLAADAPVADTPAARTIAVVGVRFRTAGRAYYFSPGELELKRSTRVVVETARGVELGTVVGAPMQLEKRQFKAPLKTVIRIATTADLDQEERNREKEREAMRVCQSKIRRHNLDMKLIDAEYTFDGSKILFYFTADGRIDFRDLVKDLAGIFRTRIELRQIGVRDETKILGGYGSCGRPLCCHTYLADFVPVSIKMAKEQNLSLNPTKISGVCGRLMCCLKNEEETYEELNKTLPRLGDEVESADGLHGEVESVNVLRQRVRIIVETNDEKELHEYDAKDLTILRRRKRGQAKPKFRREDAAGSGSSVTSHVKEAVARRQQALAQETADLHAAVEGNAASAGIAASAGPETGSGDGHRNTRRDRPPRRPRNDRNREGRPREHAGDGAPSRKPNAQGQHNAQGTHGGTPGQQDGQDRRPRHGRRGHGRSGQPGPRPQGQKES